MQYVQEISSNVPETLVLGCDLLESIFGWIKEPHVCPHYKQTIIAKDLWQRWQSVRPNTFLLGTAGRCNLRELIVQKAEGRGQLPATITNISLARGEDQLNFIINKVSISMPEKSSKM